MHIPPYNNKNVPIININNHKVPLVYFNIIKLNNYVFTNCMIVFNLFYFYVWTLISSSFSLWFPYQNLLIKLL